MEENVSLSISEIYTQAVSFGAVARLAVDKNDGIEERPACLLFAQLFSLNKNFQDEDINTIMIIFADVLLYRKIMANSPGEIVFPEWDPSQTEFLEYRDIADAFMILEAFELCAKENFRLPPEQYLRPLFGVSGAVMEGVRDGFALKAEGMENRYQTYLSNSTPEVDESLRSQLKSIGVFLKELRKARAN